MTPDKNKSSTNSLYILKTSQAVVHISHSITLRQYKYWILLLHFYRESYKENTIASHDVLCRVPIAKLAEYLGYEPVKAELKDDFEVLRKEPILSIFCRKMVIKFSEAWDLFQSGRFPVKRSVFACLLFCRM